MCGASIKLVYILDGWAKSDVEYVWKDGNPVQLANNLSLPGGFKLGAFGSEYCDVVTATGKKVIAAKKRLYSLPNKRFGKPCLNYNLTF